MLDVLRPSGNVLRRKVAAVGLVVGSLATGACANYSVPEATFSIKAFCPEGANLRVTDTYVDDDSSSRGYNEAYDDAVVAVGCEGPEDYHNVPPMLFGPGEPVDQEALDTRFSWQGHVPSNVVVDATGPGVKEGPVLGMDMNSDGSGVANIIVPGPAVIDDAMVVRAET